MVNFAKFFFLVVPWRGPYWNASFLLHLGKCFKRVQPRINCSPACWWVAVDILGWKFCTVYLCTEDPPSKEKEACFKEEDEEGETEAGRLCTWRVDFFPTLYSVLLNYTLLEKFSLCGVPGVMLVFIFALCSTDWNLSILLTYLGQIVSCLTPHLACPRIIENLWEKFILPNNS